MKSNRRYLRSGAFSETLSRITDKIIPIMEEWRSRRLEEVYAIVYRYCQVFCVNS